MVRDNVKPGIIRKIQHITMGLILLGNKKLIIFRTGVFRQITMTIDAIIQGHLLNQLMVRLFGCDRSKNAHIERKKSKMTFVVDHKPTRQEEKEIETEMNRLIELDMPVTYEFVDRDHIPANVKLDRLPDDASETLRLVRIGDYDVCPCIGKHVRSTAQIGKFVLLGTNWDEHAHSLRIRFKIVQ